MHDGARDALDALVGALDQLIAADLDVEHVPHLRLEGAKAGMEPLGRRIIETPVNTEYTERLRNPRSGFTAYGAFVWDLNKQYTDVLRGDQCTSADAAGLPIAALLPTADEVAAGSVPHAIRFILPNARMKRQVYVRPATHADAGVGAEQVDGAMVGLDALDQIGRAHV